MNVTPEEIAKEMDELSDLFLTFSAYLKQRSSRSTILLKGNTIERGCEDLELRHGRKRIMVAEVSFDLKFLVRKVYQDFN